VPTTDDVDATISNHMPEHLFTRGWIALGVAVVLLLMAQKIFTRFENKIPERI
jgi:ABC-2 type transport system permease protein